MRSFSLALSREWQSQISFASRMPVSSIYQLNRPAMRLGNLLREYKADSGATRLGRVERHEKIAGIG